MDSTFSILIGLHFRIILYHRLGDVSVPSLCVINPDDMLTCEGLHNDKNAIIAPIPKHVPQDVCGGKIDMDEIAMDGNQRRHMIERKESLTR